MTTTVTVLAPIKLAADKTETDLLAASERFQNEFVSHHPGVIRRELIRTGDGHYLDIVQFRSSEDAEDVMQKEKESAVCHAFFAVMDLTDMDDSNIEFYPSVATYP